jgi:hypothetical protein
MRKQQKLGKNIVDGIDFTGRPGLLQAYRRDKAKTKNCCRGNRSALRRKYSSRIAKGP